MISWEYSFEKISKDLELAKKKKQALDDLLSTGRISQPTFDSFEKELTNTISEIEEQQKALAQKMITKVDDLEQQVSTLEKFLANAEILHAAGEIDEELHTRETNAFTQGLEATKQELEVIKGIVSTLMPEKMEPTPPATPEETLEAVPTEDALEETPEIPAEAPITMQVDAENESIPEQAEVEHPVEVQADATTTEETPSEETPTEEMLTEEAPVEDTPVEETPLEEAVTEEELVEESTPAEETIEETRTEETLTEETADEGFESFEENAPEISLEEVPTDEQPIQPEEAVESVEEPQELAADTVEDEEPVEEEASVEVDAEEISAPQEEEVATEEEIEEQY